MHTIKVQGHATLTAPILDDPDEVCAIQLLAETAWRHRSHLVQYHPKAFAVINGKVLQVDVDACCRATRPTHLGKTMQELLCCSARGYREIMVRTRSAFERFYQGTLVPAGILFFGEDTPLSRMPGRKLLISGPGCRDQLLHMDSLCPSLVGNVYLRATGYEGVPIVPTRFRADPPGAPTHPRDLSDDLQAAAMAGGIPWDQREETGPGMLKHNQAVVFAGNVVHGGPAARDGLLRIVLFQYLRPGYVPEEDLSDYQEFEFSVNYRLHGAHALSTRQALRNTRGRWRDHFHEKKGNSQFEALECADKGQFGE